MKNSAIAITLCSALLASLTSCGPSTTPSSPPPVLPDPGPDGEYHRQLPQPPPIESRYIGMDLGAEIEACNIQTPKFFFDESSTPRPQDLAEVEALAKCLNQPEIVDNDVKLVGRTDPRGTKAYNQELSLERAETVKNYLVKYGVSPERIQVSGAGETEAVGDQPMYSYGYDRRVDSILVGVVVHP